MVFFNQDRRFEPNLNGPDTSLFWTKPLLYNKPIMILGCYESLFHPFYNILSIQILL